MTAADLLGQAVRNNAVWCDAVCRAHGQPGEFRDDIWVARYPVPPRYPNAVTLTGARSADAQLASIRELIDARIADEWAVKDSYGVLDLTPLGFQVLFDATWIHRPASLPMPPADVAGVSWKRIDCAIDLAAWETAWCGDQRGSPRVFLPPLLADATVAILAAYRDGRILAGGIANRSGEVVGWSNYFASSLGAERRLAAGCLAAGTAIFPGRPIVGYEAGASLAAAHALGFEAIGPLRIWLRREPTAP